MATEVPLSDTRQRRYPLLFDFYDDGEHRSSRSNRLAGAVFQTQPLRLHRLVVEQLHLATDPDAVHQALSPWDGKARLLGSRDLIVVFSRFVNDSLPQSKPKPWLTVTHIIAERAAGKAIDPGSVLRDELSGFKEEALDDVERALLATLDAEDKAAVAVLCCLEGEDRDNALVHLAELTS